MNVNLFYLAVYRIIVELALFFDKAA